MLKKILWSAFVAGIATVALMGASALWAPHLLWLAAIASAAVGWLVYDLHEVWQAIPVAFAKTGAAASDSWDKLGRPIVAFFGRKHPFIYTNMVIGCFLMLGIVLALPPPNEFYLLSMVVGCIAFWAFGWLMSSAAIAFAAEAGTHYQDTIVDIEDDDYSWRQLLRLAWLGIYHELILRLPAGLLTLIRLVHSHKRTLVSVSGLLGGTVAMIGFAVGGPAQGTAVDYATVLLFGGIISAAIAGACHRLISKFAPLRT